ncbi:MAG: inositol-3-phosphate synthase [Pseudomonadota bacterium]
MSVEPLRIALVGVGNCAAAFLAGLERYRESPESDEGLMHREIGGWRCGDLRIVAAFDVDHRKVGQKLGTAAVAEPNCVALPPTPGAWHDVTVDMGPILDGVGAHMSEHFEQKAFQIATDCKAADVAQTILATKADVLINYLPVGADKAAAHYAEACIATKCAFVNCTPTFIASDRTFASRFEQAHVPIVGDDIKSQVGATILHRTLARLMEDRGAILERSYQLNVGGNADFLNMLDRTRLKSKKISKTNSVQSVLRKPLAGDQLHVGPSDFVPWLGDTKIAFIRLEGRGFAGAPIAIDVRLEVEDSPNSAGVVVDAVRCAGLARSRGLGGPINAACAFLMKSPPGQMADDDARRLLDAFIRSVG